MYVSMSTLAASPVRVYVETDYCKLPPKDPKHTPEERKLAVREWRAQAQADARHAVVMAGVVLKKAGFQFRSVEDYGWAQLTLTGGPESAPAKVVYWYNRRARSWVVQLLDGEGNQIGDADYSGTESDRDWELARLKKLHPALPVEHWKNATPDCKCVGRGSGDGCGYAGGKSGGICPKCGGMLLSKSARTAAIKLVAAWSKQDAGGAL